MLIKLLPGLIPSYITHKHARGLQTVFLGQICWVSWGLFSVFTAKHTDGESSSTSNGSSCTVTSGSTQYNRTEMNKLQCRPSLNRKPGQHFRALRRSNTGREYILFYLLQNVFLYQCVEDCVQRLLESAAQNTSTPAEFEIAFFLCDH